VIVIMKNLEMAQALTVFIRAGEAVLDVIDVACLRQTGGRCFKTVVGWRNFNTDQVMHAVMGPFHSI
jgi:hypothetical protein